MIRLLKMNLYKLVISKRTWITCGVSAAIYIFTVLVQNTMVIEGESLNEIVNVFDVALSLIQGFSLIYIIICAVCFTTDNYKTRYINNIFGITSRKYKFVLAEFVTMALYVVILFITSTFAIIIASLLTKGGRLSWSHAGLFLKEIGVYFIIYMGIVSLVAFLANLLRRNIALTIGLIYSLLFFSTLYSLVDYLIEKIGIHNFTVYDYTIFGMLVQLDENDCNSMLLRAIIVAVVYIILFNIGSILLVKKRDVR